MNFLNYSLHHLIVWSEILKAVYTDRMSFRGLIETKTLDSWSVRSLRKSSACPSRGYWAAINAWFSQKDYNKQKVQCTKDEE